MSTRCMIEVDHCAVKLYRHSDGYPEGESGVLASLIPQCKKFLAHRGWDPSYLLARIAQWQMDESDADMAEFRKGQNMKPQVECLSFGLDTQYHGDLEYVYIIKLIDQKPVVAVYFFDYKKGKPGECLSVHEL